MLPKWSTLSSEYTQNLQLRVCSTNERRVDVQYVEVALSSGGYYAEYAHRLELLLGSCHGSFREIGVGADV